jgi:PAS domain S-box-containing protein/excisionase family DNA binding protein
MRNHLLTTAEIAQWLNVKVETVRRWVRQGKLPGLLLGRAGYRIRQEDLDRFMQGHKSACFSPEALGKANQMMTRMFDGLMADWSYVLHQVFTTGKPMAFSFPSISGPCVYQVRLTPKFDEQEQVVSDLKVSYDIVDLSTTHQRMLQLLDLAHDAILVRDPTGRILYWNQGAEQLYGWTVQEALGQITHVLLATRFPCSPEALEASLAERGRWEGTLQHRRRDGSALLVESRHVLVRSATGQPEAILEINRDITERERLREEREEARTRELAAQEATRQMDAFLSMVSHELKSPLTAIQGNLQLAERKLRRLQAPIMTPTPAGEEPLAGVLRFIEQAQWQIGVQTRLVNDLIDSSRIQADRLELQVGRCDLVQLAQKVVEDQRLSAPTRQIELHTSVSELLALADAQRVGQVITNYLTNALKYSKASHPVQVSISLEGQMARVAVRDEGPGLTPEQQQRIWERFYRVPGIEVQSSTGVGLGLGLYICKRLIELQGGQVGVQSAPGHGSTFWFTLPLTR